MAPFGESSLPCDDVLVELPSTSGAFVAAVFPGAASGSVLVKSPSASLDVLHGSVGSLFGCLALLVTLSASALCEEFCLCSLRPSCAVFTLVCHWCHDCGCQHFMHGMCSS